MKDDAKTLVSKLLRGIATGHVPTVRDAWRALLARPDAVVDAVCERLTSAAWSENPRGPLPQYLGVLLSLLDQLDPSVFAREIDRLRAERLHPVHRRTVDLLARRLTDSPAAHIGQGVPVFVARDIEAREQVIRNLKGWSRTRGLSLDAVSRIDVVSRVGDLDYLGKYNIFFSGIILTWPAGPARGLRLWYLRLDAEFTFYHEVGHHVMGHVEGGTVAQQEAEADAYARQMIRAAHPVLVSLARALLWPLKPLLRKLGARFDRETDKVGAH